MPFALTDEQSALSATVGEFLRARADSNDLWAEACALDIPAMAIPEVDGGLGLGAVDLVAVAEAAGGALAPIPLLTTVAIFTPMVAQARGEARGAVLGSLLAGATATATIPFGDAGWAELKDDRLTLTRSIIAEVERAEWIGIPTRSSSGPLLIAVRGASLTTTPLDAIDPSRPLAALELEHQALDDPAILVTNLRPALATAIVSIAGELMGVGGELILRSVAHARERKQFGVPIGSFQAVKHQLVDAHLAVERARSLTYRAAVAIDQGEDDAAERHAHVAYAAAAESATRAARTAVQVHGGIGITAEHDISRLYLRARQASAWLGAAETHYAAAAALR